MALRVLLLRKKLSEHEAHLRTLEETAAGFSTREAELATAIDEAETDEEKVVVEESVAAFEAECEANATAQEETRTAIETLLAEIREAEENAKKARSKQPAEAQRKDERKMENNAVQTRTKFFGMTVQERDAFMARQDVKDFLSRVRELKGQTRAVNGAELGIPTVMLDLLRENIVHYSKLVSRVKFKPLKGKARQNIAGTIPEAVWTEAVGSLNELELSFTQVEIDGYKIAGYLAVPNSTLEDDDDLNLATELLDILGASLGRGCDKSIVYGTGVKMPVGYMTRLAATTQPAWWGPNQGAFSNLSATHIQKITGSNLTGVEFFSKLISALGVADPAYSLSGKPTWVMNRKTHLDIMTRALAFNSSAALAAGMSNTMPIIGGDIIELDFVPDYEINGGYLDVYPMVERAGANLRSSDIPLLLQDQTVFVATQRMDGKPAKGEAFVGVRYDGNAPTTSVEFAEDTANSEASAASEEDDV